MPDEVGSAPPSSERPPRPTLRIEIPPEAILRSLPTDLPSDSSIHSLLASGTGSLFGSPPPPESNSQPPPSRPPPPSRDPWTITASVPHQVLRAPPNLSLCAFADRLLPARPDPIDMCISVYPGQPGDFRELIEVQTASLQNLRTHVDFRTWSRWNSRRTALISDLFLRECYQDGTLWVAAAKLATGMNWIVGFATGHR